MRRTQHRVLPSVGFHHRAEAHSRIARQHGDPSSLPASRLRDQMNQRTPCASTGEFFNTIRHKRSFHIRVICESSHPITQSRCRLGEAYRFVGNNSLEAPLNVSTHGEHSSASTENSDGIDPDYCC